MTGVVGVEPSRSPRFPPSEPAETERARRDSPVRRMLRDTDRGPDGCRRPHSVVPAGGGRPGPKSVPIGLP